MQSNQASDNFAHYRKLIMCYRELKQAALGGPESFESAWLSLNEGQQAHMKEHYKRLCALAQHSLGEENL